MERKRVTWEEAEDWRGAYEDGMTIEEIALYTGRSRFIACVVGPHVYYTCMANAHYTTLKAGCFRGLAYALVVQGGGELLCRIGTDMYRWSPASEWPRISLVRTSDGYVWPDKVFVDHVNRVADRNLTRIGS